MLQNSNGANIYVVDGKSWTIGERKISMWSESKCNKTEVDKIENDKTVLNKSAVNETNADKTNADKTDN